MVEAAIAARIQEATGIDVAGLTHCIDYGHVRHAMARHGPNGKADHSIDEADVDNLPLVTGSPDVIEAGFEPNTIEYHKRVGQNHVVIEFVRGVRDRKLVFKTK